MKTNRYFKCPVCGVEEELEYMSTWTGFKRPVMKRVCVCSNCMFEIEFYPEHYKKIKILLFPYPDRTEELGKEIEEMKKYISSQNKGLRISEFLHKNLELQKENAELKERIGRMKDTLSDKNIKNFGEPTVLLSILRQIINADTGDKE